MSFIVNDESCIALLKQAEAAMGRAYVPYSNFRVGAALVDAQGFVHVGCNIENAAYGPTNCAERTALFSAIARGQKPHSFQALAVIGDTSEPISPCGVCRQVIIELMDKDTPIILGNLKGDWKVTTAAQLLPDAFVPASLSKEEK